MMAAESGGLLARKKDTCLQFTSAPSSVVYLPSLNCLVGTLCNDTVEVLDIHSGCLLKQVDYTAENADDSDGNLLCTLIDDSEKICISKGNVIGCRGIYGEKILLDSILQYDNKENTKLKVELDIVQAGILLNGLQNCQQHISSSKQFATDKVKVEEEVRTVTDELQKQYEKSIRTVKNFTNKSVKWMTVCLQLEKSLLGDAFVFIYSFMSTQNPALPIIGDIVRRISLFSPPKKKNDLTRIDRIMMLGEVERLDSFKTWPHQNYEYALPGPMAEAGFYHPTYSSPSEDRAICFKCDICLVYWEPSDQPWSEHERHSSSCPFVKGEYTGNVPLSICSAVCHAQSLKDRSEKVICVGSQSIEGLIVVGTNKGNVYLLETFPLLKLKGKLKIRVLLSMPDELDIKGCNAEDGSDLGKSSSSSSLSNEQDDISNTNNKIEIATLFEEPYEHSKIEDISDKPSSDNNESVIESQDGLNVDKLDDIKADCNKTDDDKTPISSPLHNRSPKRNLCPIEIQALTLAKRLQIDDNGERKFNNYVIVGSKCTSKPKKGKDPLSILIIDQHDMKKIEAKKADPKSKKAGNVGVNPPFPNIMPDSLFQHDFDSYVPSDTGELSVINEYLRASKQKSKEGNKSKHGADRKKGRKKLQEVFLPDFIDASVHRISHLYATNSSLFVIVKCEDVLNEGTASRTTLENQDDSASLDSETEIIDLPNASQVEDKSCCYIFEYHWITQGDIVTICDSHANLRKFSTQDYLHDVIMISGKNLGIREQCLDAVGERSLDSSGSELLLAAAGLDRKKLLVINTLDLTDQSVLMLDTLDADCKIQKLVYCIGISVVACCLDDGKVVLCDLEGHAKEPVEDKSSEQTPIAAQALDGPLNDEKLSQLLHLIQFEPISSGVHVFLPMDWVVGRASLSANAPLQSKRRLHPHVQDIYPISSPALLRGANGNSGQKMKEKRLQSKGQNVTFKVFVSSETAIGYIDLAIECSSAISEQANMFVSLYLMEENQNDDNKTDDDKQRELICGPVSLLDYRTNGDCKASLMLTSPKLTSVKSGYLAVDLECLSNCNDENPGAEPQGSTSSTDDTFKSSRVAIADFVSNVQIVIYQYLPVMPDASLPPSCRMHLLENIDIQRKLLRQLVAAVCSGQCLGEESEGRKCLEVFLWIWHILAFSEDSLRQQLVELVEENLIDLIKVCFVRGDRTLAHRIYQLAISICRYSEKIGYSSFMQQLFIALNQVIEELENFSSVGALRWFFRLCNAAVKSSSQHDIEALFRSMLTSLAAITKFYKKGISDEQMVLQTRFDLVGTPLEPIIAEPVHINLVMGDATKAKQESQNASEAPPNEKEILPISASEVPGILEVHQLGFACLMTSEGSKCETVASPSDAIRQSLRVSLEPQKSHAHVEKPASSSLDEYMAFLPYYDDLNNIEPDIPNHYIVMDHDDYASATNYEAANYDLWTPDTSQNKMKVVRKRGRSVKQFQAPDIDNEFVTPEAVLLVVERMHAAAQHFAVLDFQRPIYLTDVLIPPCSSLASISVYAWKENQSEKEALHVVTSSEIGQKALILTDVVPSIKCKYLKIIANGSRKLASTKISIALGNYYGRPADGTYDSNQLKSRLQQQYDRVFCRYALACDRLSNVIGDFIDSAPTEMLPGDSRNKLTKAYSDCVDMQLCLNHVFHSLKFYETKTNTTAQSAVKKQDRTLALDFTRVLIECFVETLLLTLQKMAKFQERPAALEMEEMNSEHFLDLFKNFCIFGPQKIRQLGCTLLQCLCEPQPWWNDFLVQAFRYCFEEKSAHRVPKNRLFTLFMRILKTSSDRKGIILSLVDLLNNSLTPLSGGRNFQEHLDLELIDWLLLVFNELLQHFDEGDWIFLTPWNEMSKESSGLETRTQEHIRTYLQEQRKKLSNFHKKLQAFATAKKKYSTMVLKIPEAASSSKELKDLLLLRRHPLFNRKKTDKDASAVEAFSLFEENDGFCRPKVGFIEKRCVVPTLNLLFKLMLASEPEADFERLILTCKVASMLSLASDITVHITEIANFQELTDLFLLSIKADSNNAPWINHAVLCFCRQMLCRKRQSFPSQLSAMADDTSIEIPVSLEEKTESSASSESSGESSETLSGQEGEPVEEKLTDIASSIATNLMKVIKESVNEKKIGNLKDDSANCLASKNRYGATYSIYHLVDGFDKSFQMESNRVYYDNLDAINQIMMNGIWGNRASIDAENPHDIEDNKEDLDMISNVFAKIAATPTGLRSFSLLICHWIAISSVTGSSSGASVDLSTMQLPTDVATALVDSLEFVDTNKYFDFLYEKALLNAVSKEDDTFCIERLTKTVAQSFQKPSQLSSTSRSLTLLRVFAKVFGSENMKEDSAKNTAQERKPSKSIPEIDKKAKHVIKTLVLGILKNERNDSSCLHEMLQLANDIPVFDIPENDDVTLSFEILRLLASSLREFVTKNKELLLLSFVQSSSKQKRLYIVDKGRQWQVGKSSTEDNDQFFQSVALLQKIIFGCLSNSDSGSNLLEMLYGKESNVLSDLLEVLLLAGDPPSQPNSKSEFPACLLPRSELYKDTLELHTGIQNVYKLILRLGHSLLDRPRMLALILSYIDKEGSQCNFISKALCCLLKTLLRSQVDIKFFIERGGLAIICDRILSHADVLKWSSNSKTGSPISDTLTEKEDQESANNKTRIDADGSELKNLAPCGRVISPPNSPPADILLQSKPNHRRSRFAAWSYQFNDDREDLVPLTIELPFAILLKQVIIYHHPSFLGNCPAEVFIEIKGCGETFIPHSPNLQTSGIQAVNIHFARGIPTKALRINMKRPLDSDVIKLNNIELFGKAALSSTNKRSGTEFDKRFHWVELLSHTLEKDETAVEELKHISSEEKPITKALLLFLNLLPSGKPHDSEILLGLLVKIFASNFDEWQQILRSCILPLEGKSKITGKRTILQAELASLLITAVVNGLNKDNKARCLSMLLRWVMGILKTDLAFDQKETHCSTVLYFKCITRLVEEHASVHKSINPSMVTSLTSTMLSVLTTMDVKDCRFRSYSGLLASLALLDGSTLEAIIKDCSSLLETTEEFRSIDRGKNRLSIVAILSQNESNNKFMISSVLPGRICSVLKEILNIVSGSATQNIRGYLSSMVVLLKCLIFALKCHSFQDWFGSHENSSFLLALIQFLSTAYLDKALLSENEFETDWVLGDIHKLQSATVSLVKRMISFNRQNQIVFIRILKTILLKETRPELSLMNNSFLKRLVLQLILEEEEVVVHLQRRDDFPHSTTPITFSNTVSRRLRISDTLSSLFPTEKPVKLPKEDRPRQQPPTSNEAGSAFLSEDWFDEGDLNDSQNFSVLLASAHSAAMKRQSNQNAADNENGDADELPLSIEYFHPLISKDCLAHELTIGQVINILNSQGDSCKNGSVTLFADIKQQKKETSVSLSQCAMLKTPAYSSLLHVFAMDEGIQLLAKHNRMCLSGEFGQTISTSIGFLMKFVPLVGFSDIFLKSTKKAEYLLRLMLGVEHNSDGDPISSSSLAADLPQLPFVALQDLFKSAPLDSDRGRGVRKDAFESDVIKLLLNHLGTLCYQKTTSKESSRKVKKAERTEVRPSYWARGTGFGTGSTASTWDVEKVIQEKRKEEDHVVCLFRVLASYIDPMDSTKLDFSEEQDFCLPQGLAHCLEESPLRSVLSNYLRNDSVLDMARHVPLFMALMEILRALASKVSLVYLLLPKTTSTSTSLGTSGAVNQLLSRLRDCADTYINRLKGSKKRKPMDPKKGVSHKKQVQKESSPTDQVNDGLNEIASEALTVLIGNIQETSKIVERQIKEYENKIRLEKNMDGSSLHGIDGQEKSDQQSLEETYLHEMKPHQFDTFEFVADEGDDGKLDFLVPFHYAETLRTAVASGDFSYSSRSRRLAQEIASLSTSLPLSFSSSVFLRCDENRLDLMKVLITGPEDTPYANGCFEFDVYFPPDYPTSPMMVNLQTTGHHSVRFNPNLYNDGKVCLSILNTWHGRPEEKWNPQTSNLLQVLVSIQSLILVPDPYFNEPGYERSRGTPIGQQNSLDYNANIKQATIKWGMLEQLRNPAPCFRRLMRRHFFLKKATILKQCDSWISQMKDHSSKKKSVSVHYEAMKRNIALLKVELDKLTEDEESTDSPAEAQLPIENHNLPEINENENLVYV